MSKKITKSGLTDLIINYVGEKLSPKDNLVTVEMIIEVFAEEFPEFVLAVAEENFIRGYSQALDDAERVKDGIRTFKTEGSGSAE